MVNDRRYKRYFIILENEDSGFGKTDKRMPKGYAKIEVRNGKGLLNVYVQDLKYFKDAKYIYRNYLISTKGKKGLYVNTGTFIIDEKGKGELKVKFNPDDVEGSGKPIEDFNVVAVIAQPIKRSSVEKEIYGPLVGYMDKQKVSWKDVLAYEENTIKEDAGLDKEYKEKYEEIINVIEKSSKELYKEDKDETKDNKTQEKEAKKAEDDKDTKKESKKEYKEYNEEYYEDESECVDSLEKNDNGVNKDKDEDNKEKVKQEIKPEKKEKAEAKAKTEKKAEIESEKKEEVKPEKKEAMKPEKKAEVKPEKKEDVKPEKKQEIKPEKKEEIKPEKKEAAKSENKQEVKPKEEIKAEDKKGKNTKTKQDQTKGYTGKKSEVHYKKYHKMVYKYIKDMLKYYEKVQPFEKNIEDYKWWKMNYDKKTMHRGFLPFFGYVLSIYSYNPQIYYMNNCHNLMNKYGHYVFGIAYDKDMEPKYYVYGVPGRYLYKDQPFQGMTGFIYWYPLEDKNPEKGDYGYWLLHIDAMTGNVVFPMKPTIPPMY